MVNNGINCKTVEVGRNCLKLFKFMEVVENYYKLQKCSLELMRMAEKCWKLLEMALKSKKNHEKMFNKC